MCESVPYEIRFAKHDEWEDAIALAWKTFLEFEAEDYAPEGVRSFQDFITDTTLHRMFVMGAYQMIVAIEDHKMVGMITLRDRKHISLLFVDKAYHHRGIGRALILYLCRYLTKEAGEKEVTVNAAPYGIGFYHRIGFMDLGPELHRDGIKYTPMKRMLAMDN